MWKLILGFIILIVIIIIIVVAMKHKLPPGFSNGDVVHCDGKIYKIDNYTKRWYPDWNTYVAQGQPAYKEVDCTALAKISTGPNM